MLVMNATPTDVEVSDDDFNNMDFAQMLEVYNYDEPTRGQILTGTVLEVRRDEVILDVGLKRDAIVTRKDITRLPENYLDSVKPGMEMPIYVLRPYDEDGELVVSINKALELEDWKLAQEYLDNDTTTEARVVDVNKGGMLVRFHRLMGFVPNSHIESIPSGVSPSRLREVKDELVGKTLQLKVIQVEQARNRLILSERAARRDARSERLQELEAGQVVTGRVVNLTNFGAFVDIGGVDGMIHISNIDHRHVAHPADVLSVGDEVKVRIDSIDVDRERIALNRKAILPDPWDAFIEAYNPGDLMEGLVTNVVDFGVFVAAPSGAQGLVHTSRMENLGASTPADMFREGDAVLVRIVGIDPERKHIELSVDDVTVAEQEEWLFRRREAEGTGEEIPNASASQAIVDADEAPDAAVDTVDTGEDTVVAE
ncbi:S1 RNA-binding domain-containing protein [Phototrophicus methaneseepsis]|uniref:S1 RNA-binding domain-containing protein n=1 Tax=Phototrophicus methaneseepsis TaxID=2710758 RepID=A0A7S8IEE3_9CHLR|nr:S1 RNA-binding domain-containing protein [Phototrophicus methaneseepsis]QPC83565.1 S1 RNA-binding domain-containing protein [Phototrophicus methaneseepsis]